MKENILKQCQTRFPLILVWLCSFSALLACDCIAPPIPQAVSNSAAVFRGTVIKKKKLGSTQHGRRLYEIHFTVIETWKGPQTPEIVVYDASPRGDCEGFGFKKGEEYLVFIRQRPITRDLEIRTDDGGKEIFRDMWSKVLPLGKEILISEICTNTQEVAAAKTRGIPPN